MAHSRNASEEIELATPWRRLRNLIADLEAGLRMAEAVKDPRVRRSIFLKQMDGAYYGFRDGIEADYGIDADMADDLGALNKAIADIEEMLAEPEPIWIRRTGRK